jgi:hypothetical protein
MAYAGAAASAPAGAPGCRAPGCGSVLEKSYNRRTKLCTTHMRASSVLIDGACRRLVWL